MQKFQLLRCRHGKSLWWPLLVQRWSVGIPSSSFPVPAGSRVLLNLAFSPSRDAAPPLQVSVDWFNFLARAEAAGPSSLHFLTPFTQLWRPDFVCYAKNSGEREGGVAISVYWFFFVCVCVDEFPQTADVCQASGGAFEAAVRARSPHFLPCCLRKYQSLQSTVTFGLYSECSLSISTKPILHHPA